MGLVGLDFETYGAVDLRVHGLHRYVNDKTFKPLIAAITDGEHSAVLDLTDEDYEERRALLIDMLKDKTIAAHNAGFEQAVLRRMGIDLPSSRFIDSAVLARALGYGSSLEAAAPQALGIDKVETGKQLIQLFSIPDRGMRQQDSDDFDPRIILAHPHQWQEFQYYCLVDAKLSLQLAEKLLPLIGASRELEYSAITLDMNSTGWPVDLDLVKEMKHRYEVNIAEVEKQFRYALEEGELNFNSHKQLVEWCAERGVRATSFDEKHVAKLITKLDKKVAALPNSPKSEGYQEVLTMLRTKQVLGGSSLKKLDTILNQANWKGRLYDQYLHIGAGATWRTTGRGVQMQNLKRLMGEGDNVEELKDPDVHWDNSKLARNLRQVFAPVHRGGRLIVGDFASVESRGLAWQADEQWKLSAYRRGEDLYKVQAGEIYGIDPAQVSKDQRQTGKVGELSCGYGAGPEAVRAFAEGMGVELTESEATSLVKGWRTANPNIVKYWEALNVALHRAVDTNREQCVSQENMVVVLTPLAAPEPLQNQTGDPRLQSMWLEMLVDNELLFTRVIHGVHAVGRDIHYWKPSARKTGNLWVDRYTDPKTGLTGRYRLYGGKLAGLLTQSLCREVFFQVLSEVAAWVDTHPNLHLIGQFHDEIVLEWEPHPTGIGLDSAMAGLEVRMSKTFLPGFPLAAAVKAGYRYTK